MNLFKRLLLKLLGKVDRKTYTYSEDLKHHIHKQDKPASSNKPSKICRKCSHPLQGGAKFCSQCGKSQK